MLNGRCAPVSCCPVPQAADKKGFVSSSFSWIDSLWTNLRNIYDFSTISPTKSAYHFPSFCYREKMICALRYSKGADNVCLDGKLAQYVYQFSFDRFVVLDGLGERYIDDFIVIDTNHDVALPFHNGVNGSGA